jgi:hypothetical protein
MYAIVFSRRRRGEDRRRDKSDGKTRKKTLRKKDDAV